jgi:hypothetical protein
MKFVHTNKYLLWRKVTDLEDYTLHLIATLVS